MTDDQTQNAAAAQGADDKPPKVLSPAAQRALAEAETRRAARAAEAAGPKELYGRNGPEPVRYGDWEIKGIACDF